jgi:hypothetical protein
MSPTAIAKKNRGIRTLSAVAVALSFLVCAASAAASHGARLPRLLTADDSNTFAIKPSSIILAADGGQLLGRLFDRRRSGYLHWSRWNSRSATATATYWFNACTPNCADSKLQLRHATVRAFHPRGGHFASLQLRLRYKGHSWTELLYCEHFPGLWSWVSTKGLIESRDR